MQIITFTPTVIGPNFGLMDNYNWLTDYLNCHKNVPKYFWKDKYIFDLKKEIKALDILTISKHLDHKVFSSKFKKEWEVRTKNNTPQELRVEIKLVQPELELPQNQQYPYIDIDIFAMYGTVLDINCCFSIMLDQSHSICLIDDFYPEIYQYGWGSVGKTIIPRLFKFLKYELPFVIDTIYVCSITDTYLYWQKLGFEITPENKWGTHYKKI